MQQLLDPSNYGYSPFVLPIGAVAVLSLFVGAWAVWYERASRVSLSLLIATLAAATYLAGFALMVGARTAGIALFWGKALYLGVPFIVPATYQFSMDLLDRRDRRRTLIRVAWAVGILHAILAVGTDLLVTDVMGVEWGFITRITLWTLPIIAWSTVLLALAVRDYVQAYTSADLVQRARIRLFAIPIAVGSLAFMDYAPSLGLPVAPWGFLFIGGFMLSAAWAVARYRLPDLTPSFAADQIVRTMADPLFVCDEHGIIAFANPAAARSFPVSHDQLVGQPLDTVFGAKQADELLRGRDAAAAEMEIMGGSGDPITVQVATNRIEVPGGRRVGTVVVARDISERKRSATELARREERFRALIEHARDTITIIGAEGQIIYDSPSTREILGYDSVESYGTLVFDRVHPEDRPAIMRAFEGLLERPGELLDAECRLRRADGEYSTFEFRAVNLLRHPAVQGVVVNGRDVTAERHLAAQLQQAQKMEAIGQLAGGVAHDFNNVLTAIHGNVALIRDELPADSPFLDELEEIEKGAARASRLTDQLLSFSRRQVTRAEVLGLNAVVRDTQRMLERIIGETIQLDLRLDARPDTIRVDRGQLEQIVVNLVVNARDAVEGAGRVEIATESVDVSARMARTADFQLAAGAYVVLTVSDDGHGMDGETRSRIFEPFFTTKEPGRGTGLGLSTVYGAVRQASGYIGIDTGPGRGTTFAVYLPREDRAVARTAPAASSPPAEASANAETVLVVEDEAPVRSLIVRVLQRRGYRVLEAENGERALEVARAQDGPIHLLVADLVMPGLSGREVAERMATVQPDMAVLLISGYTADEVVRQGILTGERDFLSKPFTPDTLTQKVADALRRRERSASD